MSLHDVDKTTTNRGMSSLNITDAVPIRMAHGTMGVTLHDAATSTSARVSIRDGHVEVYRSDDTLVARVGVRPSDSDGALETAKPGDAL